MATTNDGTVVIGASTAGTSAPEMAAINGGIVVIGGGVALLHAVQDASKSGQKVTAVCGNPFLEWNLAACHFLVRTERHTEFLAPNPEEWKLKGVDYVFGKVTEVDPVTKKVKLVQTSYAGEDELKASGPILHHQASNAEISYNVLIVATGSRLPLIIATPGHSLEQRQKEVKEAGEAIKAAKTIVINGAGTVGIEMAGDIRAAYPDKRVVLLSRDGKVIGFHRDEFQLKVRTQLDKMNIEVIKGSVTDAAYTEPKLTSGKVALSNSDLTELDYDVFIPAFAQGPNTQFFARAEGVLNDRKQIIVNESLQNEKHPEIFAVGTSTIPIKRHPVSAAIAEQANTAALNAVNLLEGKPMKKHVEKAMCDLPMNIKIGHGVGAYMFWDSAAIPAPAKCCCCLPCGGGFPFCPPPCCWCCCKGCSGLFGNCCKPYEGEGPAVWIMETGNKMFPKSHGFKGMGSAPKQATMD